jgi:WS/DGAT/MGAT family acyltransferase
MRDLAELTNTCISLLHDDPAPGTPLNGRLTYRRRIAWRTFPLGDLAALRSDSGSTLNDVALAIICGALRRYLWRHARSSTRKVLRAVVPVSLRTPEEASSLGNALSAMFPRLPVHLADPLARLEWITRETRALKERGQPRAMATLIGMLGGVPPAVEAFLPRVLPEQSVFNTVCTNVRGPIGARTLAGLPILALHAAVPLAYGMGAGFAVMSHAARLSITVTLDPSVVRGGDAFIYDLDASHADLLRAHQQRSSRARPVTLRGPQLRPPARYQPAEPASEARARRAARRAGARPKRP